jgi:hypothetical protein
MLLPFKFKCLRNMNGNLLLTVLPDHWPPAMKLATGLLKLRCTSAGEVWQSIRATRGDEEQVGSRGIAAVGNGHPGLRAGKNTAL